MVSEAVPAGGRGEVVGVLIPSGEGVAAPSMAVDMPNLDDIPSMHVGYDCVNGFFD